MWPRLSAEDFRIVGHYLGYLVVFTGAAMCVPLIVALLQNSTAISVNYGIGVGICLLVGFALCMLKISPTNLKRRQAVVITALAWLVCSVVAALPLYLSGHYASYFDSMFEAMSGLTTSGFTMCIDIEHMSSPDIMWRFIMQFVGGQGIVVVALTIGAFARGSNRASLYDSEGRHDHVMPEIRQTALFIFRFSIAVIAVSSVVLACVLVSKGFSGADVALHSVCLSIGAFDTAGFSLTSLGVPYYHSWTLEIILMVIMLMGAISFALYARLFKGRMRDVAKNYEIHIYVVWIVVSLILVMITLVIGGYLNGTDTMLRKGVFTVVSATTNTGSQVISSSQMSNLMSAGTVFVLSVAMSIGGMSESMAGGIKALRIGIIVKEIVLRIKQVLAPDSVRMTATYENVGRKMVTQSMVSAALVVTMLFIVSFLVGAVVAMACGYDAIPAIFDSVSAATNNGLSTGLISPTAPIVMKVTYFVQMWLGRLEFLTALAFICALIASFRPVGRRHAE